VLEGPVGPPRVGFRSGNVADVTNPALLTPLRTFSRVLTLLETRPEPELLQPTSLHLA
jgi:hypothetical protein